MLLTSLVATMVVLSLVLLGVAIRLLRRLSALQQIDDRLEHFAEAVALLTETTETGFRASAAELTRIAATQRRSHQLRAVTDRLAEATALGESLPQIARAEGMSETEAQLRSRLAHPPDQSTAAVEGHVGAM